MVKAKAAGRAKMFIELITSIRLIAHNCRPERIVTISYVKKGKRSTPRFSASILIHPPSEARIMMG